MDQLNIKYDQVNPQWNYTIYPRTEKKKAKGKPYFGLTSKWPESAGRRRIGRAWCSTA
jgi:hypothetical protein